MQEWKDLFCVELGVCHDFNVVRDSFECLEEFHTIYYNLTYFPTWETNVGIWVVEGVVFVVEGQKHPTKTLVK
jgi:hypothetical protein